MLILIFRLAIVSVGIIRHFVAVAPNGVDAEIGLVRVEFLSDPLDKVIDSAGVADILIIPNIFEKLIAGEHAVLVRDHEVEEIELHRGERNIGLFSVLGSDGASLRRIDDEISAANRLSVGFFGSHPVKSSEHRLDAGNKFLWR